MPPHNDSTKTKNVRHVLVCGNQHHKFQPLSNSPSLPPSSHHHQLQACIIYFPPPPPPYFLFKERDILARPGVFNQSLEVTLLFSLKKVPSFFVHSHIECQHMFPYPLLWLATAAASIILLQHCPPNNIIPQKGKGKGRGRRGGGMCNWRPSLLAYM